MLNQINLSIISIINIFFLTFSIFNLFKRKHIVNLLISFSILSLVLLEIGKFSLTFDSANRNVIVGFGLCLLLISWLILSISLLPSKSNYLYRIVLSPILCFVALIFLLIYWINPFIIIDNYTDTAAISQLAKYFFILFILILSFSLSNLEKGIFAFKDKSLLLFFTSSLFFIIPYILFAAYAVLFSRINVSILTYSSFSVFIGGLIFFFSSYKGVSLGIVKEETAINTSVILFLIGGYLFFIGGCIKLFQIFGWNVHSLFSFLTTLFILFASLFLFLASSLKERVKNFILKNVSRERHDWQKIWEDFTYNISLITETEKLKEKIKEAISKLINVYGVDVFIFDETVPFENDFCEWMLRQADAFGVKDVFPDGNGNLEDDKNKNALKYPKALRFFKEKKIEIASPLYGGRQIIGIIGLSLDSSHFLDKELLKVLSLQASSVIVNCRTYQRLRDAEKKESLYRLSSFVIHDLKNCVNSLSLLLNNKDKFHRADFQKDALFALGYTIEKMKNLIDEFKSLRGDLIISKKECNIRDLMNEVIKDIGQDKLRNIELINDVENVIINVDSHYIYKVIINILHNAVEAVRHNGRVMIKSEYNNGFITFSVNDNGCGMSREFIENNLFKPFNSTKHKGLGIGLYQCKTIIDAHSGTIEVDSKEGEGTVFRVKLPR